MTSKLFWCYTEYNPISSERVKPSSDALKLVARHFIIIVITITTTTIMITMTIIRHFKTGPFPKVQRRFSQNESWKILLQLQQKSKI